jgi:hypothetical protein
MTKSEHPPWASGPGEILRHGLSLLKKDSDTNRRLAMISIDNAVELMIKTYLGLPSRITGLKIKRSEYQEFSESFPKLLDALEKYAADKINGIDLGEIEWYHRLRNELYHQGNGLTVERDKIEVYSELANLLFVNLFGLRLIAPEDDKTRILGDFMDAWISFERILTNISAPDKSHKMPLYRIKQLHDEGKLSEAEMAEMDNFRRVRNEVIHGHAKHEATLRPEMISRLKILTEKIANIK